MNNTLVVAPRLSKLIPLLGSDKDGEVVATARAIERTLAGARMDWHDLAELLTAPPIPPAPVRSSCPGAGTRTDWRTMARHCADEWDYLSAKERDFIISLAQWRGRPTVRQFAWLQAIFEEVGGGR